VDTLEATLQTILDENRKNRHLLKSAHEYVKHRMYERYKILIWLL